MTDWESLKRRFDRLQGEFIFEPTHESCQVPLPVSEIPTGTIWRCECGELWALVPANPFADIRHPYWRRLQGLNHGERRRMRQRGAPASLVELKALAQQEEAEERLKKAQQEVKEWTEWET